MSATKDSLINIAMACSQKTVVFTIDNDNFPKRTDDKSGSGIGVKNLEKRLQLLYPNKFKFETKVEDGRFFVRLEIETA